MAAIENENIYGLTIRESATDGSDFTNPGADYRRFFLGEDGLIHVKDAAGVVTSPYSISAVAFIGARVSEATAQTITHNTFTALTFNDADVIDTDAFHDPASNNTRLTIPTGRAGKYLITANCSWFAGGNFAGQRFIGIRLNGATYLGRQAMAPGGVAAGSRHMSVMAGPVALAVADYVEALVFHTDGANLDVGGASNEHYFSLQFLGT